MISILIRYTCDENGTESDDLQREIDLLRKVKDTLMIDCSDTCTAYRAERIFTGTHGRLKFNIPREQLLEQRFYHPCYCQYPWCKFTNCREAAEGEWIESQIIVQHNQRP